MSRTIARIRTTALVLAAATGALLASAGSAEAVSTVPVGTPAQPATVGEVWSAQLAAGLLDFDCRLDGDRACLVRIVNADEDNGSAMLYRYAFDTSGRPTAYVRPAGNQATEDDRYIAEQGKRTAQGAWDCRWDGDRKCVGKLGGVRYVFPFSDGSPLTPYRSAWQG